MLTTLATLSATSSPWLSSAMPSPPHGAMVPPGGIDRARFVRNPVLLSVVNP
jgi:hypothetical protein